MNDNFTIRSFIFAILFISILPAILVQDTVDAEHFYSSHHMFEHAYDNGFQFGIDIIDNVGPYGFLHYPFTYVGGGSFWIKMSWWALICFVYAFYSMLLLRFIRGLPEKLLFIFVVSYFPLQIAFPWFSYENIPRLAVFFSGIYLLMNQFDVEDWREKAHIIFTGLFYAFITIEKSSNSFLLILIILTISFYFIINKRWKASLLLVGTYVAGWLIFWLSAGQHFSNIPTFFISLAFFIASHQAVLPIDISPQNLKFGIFYFSSISFLVLFRIALSFHADKPHKILPDELFRAALVALFFLVFWKHGTLRSTGSLGCLVYPVPILMAYVCLFPISSTSRLSNHAGSHVILLRRVSPVILLAILLSVALENDASFRGELGLKTGIQQEFENRLSNLISYRPVEKHDALNEKFIRLKNDNALPEEIRHYIGSGRIDELGHLPSVALLNDLNYRPRPIPIDYIAATTALKQINGSYYGKMESAPDFVFFPEYGFRLVDTDAYLNFLFNYQAVYEHKKWLIFEKNPSWKRISRKAFASKDILFDQWVPLTDHQNLFLWVNIDASHTILGRLKKFIYHMDPVKFELLLDDGSIETRNASLPTLKSGFLINPTLKQKAEQITLASDEAPWNPAKAFRISLKNSDQQPFFNPGIRVHFSTITASSDEGTDSGPIDMEKAGKLIKTISDKFVRQGIIPPVDLFSIDASHYNNNYLTIQGIGGMEGTHPDTFRWAMGPKTRVEFFLNPLLPQQDRELILKFNFKHALPFPKQTVTIRLNGDVIRFFSREETGTHAPVDPYIPFTGEKGKNIIEIEYHDWNHGKTEAVPGDPRSLAVVVMDFAILRGKNH